MLETAVNNGAEQLRLQQEVAEARRVDAHIGAPSREENIVAGPRVLVGDVRLQQGRTQKGRVYRNKRKVSGGKGGNGEGSKKMTARTAQCVAERHRESIETATPGKSSTRQRRRPNNIIFSTSDDADATTPGLSIGGRVQPSKVPSSGSRRLIAVVARYLVG